MSDTKTKLLDGTSEALRLHGIAGASARTIAGVAGVNQALIFYHFGSVDELLVAACLRAAESRVALYRDRFAAVGSLRELLAVGRELHAEEREVGNVAVLAQLLAGAQAESASGGPLAVATGRALELWIAEIEAVLGRLLAATPLAGVADIPGLARAVAAAFVGVELYEGVDPNGAERALAALDQVAVIVDVLEEAGPVARRVIRAKLRRAGSTRGR